MTELIYHVYLKSFQDSNNDGIGDLNGLYERLPLIAELGITAVWLSPIFTSPGIDNGYDVSDYYKIAPEYGTLADLQRVIALAKQFDIVLYLDLVINHTSNQHPWFQAALSDKHSPYRDYYLWQDATPTQPPTNWASFFGGSTWQYDDPSEQAYFHLFAPEMPDLNWENPAVINDLAAIAAYWINQGIAGFRLDAVSHLAKDERYLSIPTTQSTPVLAECYYANLPRNFDHLAAFKTAIMARTTQPFVLIGEAASAQPADVPRYFEALDCLITFGHFQTKARGNTGIAQHLQQLDLPAFKQRLLAYQQQSASGQMALYLSNHDHPRAVSRFADESANAALALLSLQLFLNGCPLIYQGEELGLTNATHPQLNDYETDPSLPAILKETTHLSMNEQRQVMRQRSKEAARGAMNWDKQPFQGFSTVPPWNKLLSPGTDYLTQRASSTSVLASYKQLLQLRRQYSDIIAQATTHFNALSDPNLFELVRETATERLIICVNMSLAPLAVPIKNEATTLFNNGYDLINQQLAPYGVLILKEEL